MTAQSSRSRIRLLESTVAASTSPSTPPAATVDDRANDAVDNDDDGFDMGWLGLLGLLGLAGLTGRNRPHAHDTVTTRRP
jgi:MYXO-CTERM domain-containing protein